QGGLPHRLLVRVPGHPHPVPHLPVHLHHQLDLGFHHRRRIVLGPGLKVHRRRVPQHLPRLFGDVGRKGSQCEDDELQGLPERRVSLMVVFALLNWYRSAMYAVTRVTRKCTLARFSASCASRAPLPVPAFWTKAASARTMRYTRLTKRYAPSTPASLRSRAL